MPRISIVADTFSGSLHSASGSRSAGFFGYGRDDSLRWDGWPYLRPRCKTDQAIQKENTHTPRNNTNHAGGFAKTPKEPFSMATTRILARPRVRYGIRLSRPLAFLIVVLQKIRAHSFRTQLS